MNQHDWIEDIARAMYEAPDANDDTYVPRAWPPSDDQDRDWFLNLAWVAANTGLDVLFRLQETLDELRRES